MNNNNMFLGLRTTIYRVGDMDQAKNWYARAFGRQPYFDEPFYIGFDIGGYELGLQPATGTEGAGGVETYWGVPDIEEAYNHLLQAGAMPHDPPRNVGGPLMVAVVKDPWNNSIGIIYNPAFGLEGP